MNTRRAPNPSGRSRLLLRLGVSVVMIVVFLGLAFLTVRVAHVVEDTTAPEETSPTPLPRPDTRPTPDLSQFEMDEPHLTVRDGQLLDLDGNPVRLLGLNRSGAEYSCVQNLGFWDGAADGDLVDAMASWGINTVRVPLNEHCWLGINGAPPELSGQAYRDAIVEFVELVNDRGLIAVLDLHWSAPGDELATDQMPMPNADHSPRFWTSVAATFLDTPLVVFDVFNEPHGVDWECWRDGCTMPEGYEAAGMQALVDAVRSTGATHPVIVSGLRWANDLTGWLEMRPDDPLDAVMAGFHLYNFNACVTRSCWDAEVRPVADVVPVVTAELGEDTCASDFVVGYLEWADENDVSYIGWTFNAWDCRAGPAMIVDEDGSPTPYGAGFRDHLLGLTTGSRG